MYLSAAMNSMRNLLLCLISAGPACEGWRTVPARLTHGPFVGDVTAVGAVVWARIEGVAAAECRIVATQTRGLNEWTSVATTSDSHDSTLRFVFTTLRPDWEYEISFPGVREAPTRRFRTAPEPDAPWPLLLAFGGDVGGQGLGRDLVEGFPIFPQILARKPDCFVGLGDMIYGDLDIPATSKLGNAQVSLGNPLRLGVRSYWTHWRYLHDDAGFAALLGKVPYVAIWDDHEVKNDFGPSHDGGLLTAGRAALFDWNPLAGPPEEPERLYRSLRLGKHCELFVLDCRSYRDPNSRKDDAPEPKTMLGAAQRAWLLAALARSDATWKVVVTSVPLCTPTGDKDKGRDSWCDHGSPFGFERELVAILREMQTLGIATPVFLTTDVHHAEVLRLAPFAEAPSFRPLEIVTGPMHAGVFGRGDLDRTLNPTSLFYLPPDPQPRTLAEAKRIWNFGLLRFAATGELTVSVVDATGAVRFSVTEQPAR